MLVDKADLKKLVVNASKVFVAVEVVSGSYVCFAVSKSVINEYLNSEESVQILQAKVSDENELIIGKMPLEG